MNRILRFHLHETSGNRATMLPCYFVDAEYEPVAVRIHAVDAPTSEAKIDIFDDGVSIFNDQGSTRVDSTTGAITTVGAGTTVTLAAGENYEESAEDFLDTDIEIGSIISCDLVDAGGGKNYTVQLELRQVSEGD
jgi:hypothetical protein